MYLLFAPSIIGVLIVGFIQVRAALSKSSNL